MNLRPVPALPPEPTEDLPEVQLAHIRAEVTSLLEDTLEELRRESVKVHATMEQTMFRLRTQGFGVKLDDLRSGRWHKVKAKVEALQEVMELFQAMD